MAFLKRQEKFYSLGHIFIEPTPKDLAPSIG